MDISVCIIAKNEEKHIEECCRRLAPYGYEIVLVDTGSVDKTVELARKYTDNIFHFEWCNDFSAAKNYAFEKASHDWILSLDCDEYIEKIDEKELALCIKKYPKDAGRILIRNRFTQDGRTAYEQVRVSRFVNRNYYGFTGSVHEQLEPKPENTPALSGLHSAKRSSHTASSNIFSAVKRVYNAPVTVLHVGYDGTEEEMQKKSARNIALLEKELEEKGADAYVYFQLGQSCRRLRNYEKALQYFDLGLAMDVEPKLDYVQTMVESYGYTLLDLKQNEAAMQLLGIYDDFAVRADFVFLIGLILMNNGMFDEAVKEFQKSTTMSEYSVDGVNSYKANYNIGVIYECRGNLPMAKKYYQKCGNYEPALARLNLYKN